MATPRKTTKRQRRAHKRRAEQGEYRRRQSVRLGRIPFTSAMRGTVWDFMVARDEGLRELELAAGIPYQTLTQVIYRLHNFHRATVSTAAWEAVVRLEGSGC